MIEVKFKKLHPDAKVPTRAHETDAGYDIYAVDDGQLVADENGYHIGCLQYQTGLSIELPPGYHAEICCRSSISKTDLILANPLGVIDFGFSGQILVRFKQVLRLIPVLSNGASPYLTGDTGIVREPTKIYKKGDKIAQLLIRKTENATFVEVEQLSATDRGDGAFGSTDRAI